MTKKHNKHSYHGESHARSILKAVTWRAMGTVITVLVAWFISKEIGLAAKLGVVDTVFKIAAFYVYERLWNRIPYGRKHHRPEYEI